MKVAGDAVTIFFDDARGGASQPVQLDSHNDII
jgi:hypothetical protein